MSCTSPTWAASAVEAHVRQMIIPLSRNQKQKPCCTEYGVASRLILTLSSYTFCEFTNYLLRTMDSVRRMCFYFQLSSRVLHDSWG
ncbi:hypothetical protein VN97_g2623 [Penicillium thymicola]|uniref:Uncharacterized protein n=1 Tax=Penicillium thymicola TaxID=293382 RepID=A0AAI9TPH1_PENTH|nr:hypothetical protein VN97_g2623 [Penicillium thymicola]